jgi:SPP1 gp7 family putative phage head morphogenesis protein
MTRPVLALDLKRGAGQSAFIRARKAEIQYARQLRKLAKHIGDLITGMWTPGDIGSADEINDALGRYANAIEPWARSVANRMLTEVAARDRKAWMETAREMGRLLGREIDSAPTGHLMRQRMADQVSLIKSLPIEAAERVHKLTLQGIVEGKRAAEIAKEIAQSGHVSASRAMLIARTEVGRTATELTKARAEHVGSTQFQWVTAGDSDVRPSHKRLNGKVFAWNDPPECDPGHRALPGAIWNCRCVPFPIIPED